MPRVLQATPIHKCLAETSADYIRPHASACMRDNILMKWVVMAQEVAESGIEASEVAKFPHSWAAANYAKHCNAAAPDEEDKRIFYVEQTEG